MQIFVSEYFTSGACCDKTLPPSLLHEGLAMLRAVLEDCAMLPDCKVATTVDARFATTWNFPGDYFPVSSITEAETLFLQLANQSNVTFVIAPETNGLLSKHREMASATNTKWAGCSTAAIALCADKLSLATFLQEHNIPTIPTNKIVSWDDAEISKRFPIVIKPRDGAGSEMTFLTKDQTDWQRAQTAYKNSSDDIIPIWQPYIAGTAVSVALLVESNQLLPLTSQQLSDDGTFQYLGGTMPFINNQTDNIYNLARTVSTLIPGLNGYVGFDFILPEDQSHRPLLVEINPRLTTSYVGYRALTEENLMHHILFPDKNSGQIDWKEKSISFKSNGTIMNSTRS